MTEERQEPTSVVEVIVARELSLYDQVEKSVCLPVPKNGYAKRRQKIF